MEKKLATFTADLGFEGTTILTVYRDTCLDVPFYRVTYDHEASADKYGDYAINYGRFFDCEFDTKHEVDRYLTNHLTMLIADISEI